MSGKNESMGDTNLKNVIFIFSEGSRRVDKSESEDKCSKNIF